MNTSPWVGIQYSSIQMSDLKTQSFLLTISTKTDISETCVEMIKRHVEGKCDYYHVVLERGSSGKLHLHAILLYPVSKDKKQLRNNFWIRYVKPSHADDGSIGSIAVKMQVAPGDKWYKEYLRKEEDVTVVATRWDDERVKSYFPDRDTQAVLQAAHGKGSRDGWIASHVDDYKSKYDVIDFDTAYEYTFRWYVEEKRDPCERFLRERAHFLYRIALGDFGPLPGDRQWNNQRCCEISY